MVDRLEMLDEMKETLQAISELAMRAAVDRMRRSQREMVPREARAEARQEFPKSAPIAARREGDSSHRSIFASGRDSDSVGDPFSDEGSDDNLLGEDEDPFSSWPSLPSVKKSKEPQSENEPDGGYIDFSLEGILDEALKVEDQGIETSPKVGSEDDEDPIAPVEDNAFAGVLEDVLGTDSSGDSSEPPTPPPSFAEDDPFLAVSEQEEDSSTGTDELDFVEEHFGAIGTEDQSAPSSPLEDLARTRLSSSVDALATGPEETEQTSPDVRVSPAQVNLGANRHADKPTRVVVPVHLSVAPDTPEMELEVTLEIKISREDD